MTSSDFCHHTIILRDTVSYGTALTLTLLSPVWKAFTSTRNQMTDTSRNPLQSCLVFQSILDLACVASVSVWFRSKERPWNGILGFGRARNETGAKKMKVGVAGEERRKRLQTNLSILKTCVRQRTQRLIGSASRTMLTCVDQRFVSYWEDGMVRDTYINFQWLLFILVGKTCPPIQGHFLWPLLQRKALLATK